MYPGKLFNCSVAIKNFEYHNKVVKKAQCALKYLRMVILLNKNQEDNTLNKISLNINIFEDTNNLIEPLAKHLSEKLNMDVSKDVVVALALRELHEREFIITHTL